ncbi:N,N-dimethylformamidase beta subunit family domain-containing protein [Chryseolinea lacunae]|uniref:N,N-dimethylformamidase beta subunit-like C-terminal domain-containing protein n=1 Tax=Chryseolinea lacunae TaxID=2801331 RepID=A0ABS1KQZ1_9BACT|nr:N,N-dimethylformamidase beta subunit family domain-containing protein [Chryseolinea lacunae]MBL0741627.1 hypothetical protein [Chryseolinea lacunae]
MVNPPPVVDPPDDLPKNACGANVTLGYTSKQSYAPDEEVTAFLQSPAAVQLCRLDIYDVKGNVAFSVASPLTEQQVVGNNPSRDGFGFLPTVKFPIPAKVKSGMYFIEGKIPFIVRRKEAVDLLIVYPSNTANAYSESGGKSLYSPQDRPPQVSFLRPIALQPFSTVCLTWFSEMTNVKIGYVADIDLDDANLLKDSKILVVVGHNEYWTRAGRKNFDAYVDNGGHALVLSGNNMWWQVRYTADKNNLVCYKNHDADPETDELLKTIEWTKESLQYSILSSLGADFPHGGYGMKPDNGWNGYKIVTPTSPLLQGLNLKKGDIISCPTSEYDGAPLMKDPDADGYPVVDNATLNFEKVELVGFDRGFRGNAETVATFLVVQKTKTSGIIVNTSSTDWCSSNGMGGTSGANIKAITQNAIQKLLNGQTVFSQ